MVNPIDIGMLIKIMNDRGFKECGRTLGKEGIIAISFLSEEMQVTKRLTIPSYLCKVYPATQEFELLYSIPKSINRVTTPKCGSVSMDDHFDKICMKFEEHIRTLYRYFK